MPIKKPRFNWLRQRPHKIVAWFQRHEKTASWGTAIFTGLIFLVTAIYAAVAFFQMRAMNATVAQTQAMVEQQKETLRYAGIQADAAKTQADLAITTAQSINESLELTRRSVNASETQANVSERMARQNESLIDATRSQANTSQVAARAARESAQISRQLYERGQRPSVFFKWIRWLEKPTADKKFSAEFVLSNTGGNAYSRSFEETVAVVPVGFQGMLPYGPIGSLPHSPPNIEVDRTPWQQGADQTFTTDFTLTLNEAGLKLFEEGKVLIVFYGYVWWRDSLGRGDGFSYCRTYNSKTYPNLIYCPSQMIIPKGQYPY
jgi:hypothetical protein